MACASLGDETIAPTERRRTDENPIEVKIVKSENIWVNDGNIILRTVSEQENSTTHTLYRVHKGVLGLHCSFFAALFDGDQGIFEMASELYDEVPVMELPDAGEDVRNFLRALYYPRDTQKHLAPQPWSPEARAPLFPESYAGILRLATKYEAHSMREQMITAFKMAWPRTLGDWDRLQGTIGSGSGRPYREPAKYIQLATVCDVPEVLPALYYELYWASEMTSRTDQGKRTRELCLADLRMLNAGQMQKLLMAKPVMRDLMGNVLHIQASRCSCLDKTRRCFSTVDEWWMLHKAGIHSHSRHYLEYLKTCEGSIPTSVCSYCRQWVKTSLFSTRQQLWDALPSLFGL